MSNKCTYEHPLVLDGTTQDSRRLASIDPTFVRLDEKTIADYLIFANRFARHLNFINLNGEIEGDWQSFFAHDVSAIIAELANWPIKRYFIFRDQLFIHLSNEPALEPEKNLKFLFDFIFAQCAVIDRYQQVLPAKTDLKEQLRNQIRSNFSARFERLLSYYKGAIAEGLIDGTATDTPSKTPVEWALAQDSIAKGFSQLWTSNTDPDWLSFWANIPVKTEPFGDPTLSNEARIRYAASYNLFTEAIKAVTDGLAQISRLAKRFLEETLSDWPNHAPNNALFITFLKLYQAAQKELNSFTKRHLDFYYQEVLKIKRKDPVPAKAHLTFNLSKPINSYALEADTLLKAGKDTNSKAIFFATQEASSLNKASIKELKQIYFDPDDNARPYIGPVANSYDGLGAKNPAETIGWNPFGNRERPLGELGFAIASPLLFLREGTGTIVINLHFKNNHSLNSSLLLNQFMIRLTTADGWLEIANPIVSITGNRELEIEANLNLIQTPILPYQADIHGGYFSTRHPLAKVMLKNNPSADYKVYEVLRSKKLSGITLSVENVKAKSLNVTTDAGPQNLSQPFLVFGAQPKAGNSFIVGSNEVFSKPLTFLELNLKWKNFPGSEKVIYSPGGSTSNPTFSYAYLGPDGWEGKDFSDDSENQPFSSDEVNIPLPAPEEITSLSLNYQENTVYKNTANAGFIKLELDNDFGHLAKQNATLSILVNAEGALDPDTLPADPYTPIIEEISLTYTASTDFVSFTSGENFEDRPLQYFHLSPFGEAEQHPLLLGSNPEVYCFPVFQDKGIPNEGVLYLGLENLRALQKVSILFQVVEGSANPLKEKPDNHVQWSFLANNIWIPFKTEELMDRTDGLINSGIITFTIPKDASTNNTLLSPGLLWIKASVSQDIDLVCKLLGTHAQAVLAAFKNKDNDLSLLEAPLEAGSINKLEKRVPSIKKVEQPYPTFDGQGLEQSNAYYTRVSERLRHKKRCVTMWDYERMILEYFPAIFLVKCISHTQKERLGNSTDFHYNELAPGHVMIIPIAKIQSTKLTDRLKPYTSLGMLKRIEKFVLGRVSPFVKLHVRNPEFNELKIECKITFQGDLDRTSYENKLNETLIGFLSPWAFSNSRTIAFGGKWHASTIIDFIEERPYVDYLTHFKLYKIVDGTETEVKEALAENAGAILVSHPQHVFQLPEDCSS